MWVVGSVGRRGDLTQGHFQRHTPLPPKAPTIFKVLTSFRNADSLANTVWCSLCSCVSHLDSLCFYLIYFAVIAAETNFSTVNITAVVESINCVLSRYPLFLDPFLCNLFACSLTVHIKGTQREIISPSTLETFVLKWLDGLGFGNILVCGRHWKEYFLKALPQKS